MAFWVIGDIHGMHDPLKQLLIEIDKNNYFLEEEEKADTIIFLGDYIDYGPSSKEGGQDTVASFANSKEITEKVFKFEQYASYSGSRRTVSRSI